MSRIHSREKIIKVTNTAIIWTTGKIIIEKSLFVFIYLCSFKLYLYGGKFKKKNLTENY